MNNRKYQPLTPNQELFIRDNFNDLSISDMARSLNIKHHLISNYCRKYRIKPVRYNYQKVFVDVLPYMVDKKYFDVTERANWLI